jgi:hypothetical protein
VALQKPLDAELKELDANKRNAAIIKSDSQKRVIGLH